MSVTRFPGPTPPETNPTIESQYYNPSRFVISALTLGTTTTVTTSSNHNYSVGQLVRLLIPQTYGSYQLNETQGYVTSIPAVNQVIVAIDSTNASAFVSSPTYGPTSPQILPIGDINTGAINTSGRTSTLTYISGSFINVSPS